MKRYLLVYVLDGDFVLVEAYASNLKHALENTVLPVGAEFYSITRVACIEQEKILCGELEKQKGDEYPWPQT